MAHLLFEYDGTNNDAAVVYAPAFRQVYKELVKNGHGEPRTFTQEALTQFLGYSAQDMWKAFKPELSEDQRQYYSRAVGAAMEKAIAAGESRWYPGAESMLATLKAQGHTLVFLSNCKHAYQETHRQAFKMDRFFDAYYCTEDYHQAPKPEIYKTIRRAVGAAMEKAIAAGESRWYPGAESMLATLKAQGHTLVFLSNCKHAYQETHRQAFKMDRFFDAYYCTEDYHQAPKPEIYKTIRRDFSQDFVVIVMALDLVFLTAFQAKRRSSISLSVGFRSVTTSSFS